MDRASPLLFRGLARFLLAVGLTAVATAVIYVAAAMFDASGPPNMLVFFWLILLQSFVVIAAIALLLVVPVSMALARLGREGAVAYVAAGAVAGFLMFELMHILLSSGISMREHLGPRALLYSAGTGGLPGAFFGLFWWQVGRRPLLKKEDHG